MLLEEGKALVLDVLCWACRLFCVGGTATPCRSRMRIAASDPTGMAVLETSFSRLFDGSQHQVQLVVFLNMTRWFGSGIKQKPKRRISVSSTPPKKSKKTRLCPGLPGRMLLRHNMEVAVALWVCEMKPIVRVAVASVHA